MPRKINENSFEGQSIFIGIDVHKKSWKVNILGKHYEHKAFSQDPDPTILASYVKKNFPGAEFHAVYEAGFSGFEACRSLNNLGINCMVIHPADVPTSAKEKLQKTDKIDSRKLARALRSGELEAIHIPAKELEANRALVRQRFRIVKDISRIKNRLKSLLFQFDISIPIEFTDYQSRHWSKTYTNWLKELTIKHESLKQTIDNYVKIGEVLRSELLTINKQIRQLSRSQLYEHNHNLLLGIPGIGTIAAMIILTELGDIKRFKRLDELCSYVGLIPRMYGSGDKMQTGKLTKRGRKILKIILIEASWIAIRKDPALMLKFNELSEKMKKNKAIIRIAKKLLSRIRFVLINQQPYEYSIVE
jgi:transposase